MIEIIPSLSILNGKAVRLSQGDYDKKVVYQEQPLEIAERFEEHGVRSLHLIDLDGARMGSVVNYAALDMITHHTNLRVDFGGGINNDGDLAKAFEYGAKTVTVGSAAVTDRDLFSGWLMSYGRNKLTLSADTDRGKIVVRGRQRGTNTELFEFVEFFYNKSLLYLKCADNERDGMLQGPNLDLYKALLAAFPDLHILASGGVSSMDDIRALEDLGVYGVIVGKAFYEGNITLKDMELHFAKA
jgi:phosphoribosylformimino-5-aminoimidazole carboxamide ribotide isomerase